MDLSSVKGITARRAVGLLVCLAISAAGCSGAGSRPTTVKVRGKVTYKGQPVTQGTVTFQPTQGPSGAVVRPAVGVLNADGSYELATFGGGDGVVPGDYVVTIRSVEGDVSLEKPDAPQVSKTPEKYADPAQSTLRTTVRADQRGPLELNFTLDD